MVMYLQKSQYYGILKMTISRTFPCLLIKQIWVYYKGQFYLQLFLLTVFWKILLVRRTFERLFIEINFS